MLHVQQMLLGSGANHPAGGARIPDAGLGWSMVAGSLYSNGTMYATIPNDGDWAVGTGDYTIEWWMWMDPNSRGNGRNWQIGEWPGAPFGVSIEGSGKNRNFYLWTNGNIALNVSFTDFEYKRWHHWCVERVSGITALYRDGVFVQQTGYSYNIYETSAPINLMSEGRGINPMAGYIADWHFVKGYYKYGGAFTPPYNSITPMTGTVCLLNAVSDAGAVVDSSTVNKTVNNVSLGWSPRGPYLAPNLWVDGTANSYSGSGTEWVNLGRDDYYAYLQGSMGTDNGAMVFNEDGFFGGPNNAYSYLTGGSYPILANLSAGITVVAVYDLVSNTNAWERIIDFGNGSSVKNIILARNGAQNSLVWDIYGASGDDRVVVNNAALPGKKLAIATDDASATHLSAAGSSTSGSGMAIPNGPRTHNYIGKSNWNGDYYLQGRIYHLSIYDRVLTTDEITLLQNKLNAQYGL